MVLDVPFNQAYWVRPGMLMASCYPGAEDPARAHRQLKGLVGHGIHHVVNLMESDELKEDIDELQPVPA